MMGESPTEKKESLSDKFVRIVFAFVLPAMIAGEIALASTMTGDGQLFGFVVVCVAIVFNSVVYFLWFREQTKNRSELLKMPPKASKVTR